MRSQYAYPDGMCPTSIRERYEFYNLEFKTGLVKDWFRGWTNPIVFAVVIGRHTRIFPARYRRNMERTILIGEYDSLEDLRRYCKEFRPESVYYDRNLYMNWSEAKRGTPKIEELGRSFGQQLAFDIDPENFDCPIHGTLEDKMNRRQGLSFCRLELQLAQEQALELMEELSGSFTELRLVYSGRGFHVHIMDQNTFFWTHKLRVRLTRSLVRRGYLMDEWVAGGGMRLIRLPHSLNGLVSRVVTPLDGAKAPFFDPMTDPRCLPNFAEK